MKYLSFTPKEILKESIPVLLFTIFLSAFGGIALKTIEAKLFIFFPLIIMLPALNSMIGDFGITMISRFTTALYMHKVKFNKRNHAPFKTTLAKHLLNEIIPIAIISITYITAFTLFLSYLKGFSFNSSAAIKLLLIAAATTTILLIIITFIAIYGSYYIFKKNKDPDDFLIPITTSIADFGAMFVLSFLVSIIF